MYLYVHLTKQPSMKKTTLLIILVLATTFGYAQNFITNGSFDGASGWTITNHYGTDSTNGSVVFADGSVKIEKIDATDEAWIHMGIYTILDLEAGWYQFDMDMSYAEINEIWGEVYIGATMPIQNEDYTGDLQVLKAYNSWECDDLKTYSGSAISAGCDDSNPGKFEIISAGTYYLVFRTGGKNFGTSSITIDDLELVTTTAAPDPELLYEFNFDFDTETFITSENLDFNENALNTVTNGINSSTSVGELTGVSNDWWSQIKIVHADGIDLSTSDRGISIKVKGPRALPVTVKIESGGEEHSVTADYTVPNSWQEILFDFSSFNSTNNTKIALFFAIQEDNTDFPDANNNIFQIDDFIFGKYATLSTQNFQIEGLVTYPNPTNTRWNISAKNQIITNIEVYNILGKMLLNLQPNTLSVNVDALNLTTGVYISKISTKLGTVTQKLIKQ
jgi:hypothetical protein